MEATKNTWRRWLRCSILKSLYYSLTMCEYNGYREIWNLIIIFNPSSLKIYALHRHPTPSLLPVNNPITNHLHTTTTLLIPFLFSPLPLPLLLFYSSSSSLFLLKFNISLPSILNTFFFSFIFHTINSLFFSLLLFLVQTALCSFENEKKRWKEDEKKIRRDEKKKWNEKKKWVCESDEAWEYLLFIFHRVFP